MECTLQGCCVRVTGPGKAPAKKRGRVEVGGSRKSLRRLSVLLGSVDWPSYKREVLFITLTLPEAYHDAEVFRVALDRFRKWMMYKFREAGAVLRIEQGTETGRLHGHLLVFGATFIPALVLRAAWARALRMPAGELPRVGIERVRNGAKLAQYLRKYIAKVAAEAPATQAGGPPALAGDTCAASAALTLSTGHIWQGRVWQVWGRDRIRFAPAYTFAIEGVALNRLRRILRRLWAGFKGSGMLFVQPSTVKKLAWYLAALDGVDCDVGSVACEGDRCHLFA